MSKPLKKHKRWSAKRKFEVVLELIKGHKSLDELSREVGQTAHVLSQWRDDFLSKGDSLFKEPESAKEKALDEESRRLKAKIGDQAMEIDLLYEKVKRLENGVPFHLRKSKT